MLVLCSGIATIVPLTLFAYAAQRVPLTVIGPLNYIVPTINFCLGWLVFHEALPPHASSDSPWYGWDWPSPPSIPRRRSRTRSMLADPIPV